MSTTKIWIKSALLWRTLFKLRIIWLTTGWGSIFRNRRSGFIKNMRINGIHNVCDSIEQQQLWSRWNDYVQIFVATNTSQIRWVHTIIMRHINVLKFIAFLFIYVHRCIAHHSNVNCTCLECPCYKQSIYLRWPYVQWCW